MAKQEKTDNKANEVSFETALKRLEEIVEQMEDGELGLDDLVVAFEEGQKLVKQCSEKLNEVERRIEVLTKNSAGDLETKTLDQAELL
ncbi:MAG: exodeoxyribonuclease VII small subunit [Lentisphaerae bacterium]|jgi:exodeoxyribonuclease VII small subunit|nr:exodeoxyribonuclease VII small subunit [Lentisphaerota bacterium]